MAPTRMKLRVRRTRRDSAAGATSSAAATRAAAAPPSPSSSSARGPRGGRAAEEEEGEQTGGRRRRRPTTTRKKSTAATRAAAAASSATNPSSNTANLRSMSGEDASPDSKCPICLDRFNNLSYLDCCLHRFCFNCIQEWSLNKAECPLCKQPFTSILHSVRAEDDFKEYTLRPPPPPPPPPGNLTAAERGGRGRRPTVRRRRGRGRGGAVEEEEEEEGPGGEGRRATTARSRRRGERAGAGEEWYLDPPATPPTPPLPAALEMHAYLDEQRRMMGEAGVIFGGLPELSLAAEDAAAMGHARACRRIMRRVATHRRLQRDGGGRGALESEMLAFRRALYRTGVRVRGVAGADSDRHHRPVTAESFRRNSAHLERLRPWLRRELTALYGAHASLVDVVQRIICARLGRHGLEDTPAVENELRPFLLARTAHFLHELLSFARSPLDMDRYDIQAVYDTLEAEADSDSSNNGSVISISEGEEEEAGGTGGGGGGSSSHHDDDIIQTGSSSFLSQSAWDDDETPGPSFTSSSVAELCSHSPGLLSVSPPIAPPARKEGGATEEAERAEAGRGGGRGGGGDDEEEEEACEIVGYVKPMAERTPELVQLSSDTEEEEQEQKTLPPPPPPPLPALPVSPSLPPPASSNAEGERDRQTDGERDRPSCRLEDGKRDGQTDREKDGGRRRDSERALDLSSGSCAHSHSAGIQDSSSALRERSERREKESSMISELLSAGAREREKRRKRKKRDICDEEEEGDNEGRRGRERGFLPLSLPGVFSTSSTPSPPLPRPARLRPASPWAPPPLSPENHLFSSCCSSSSSSPLSSLLSSPLSYLPLSPGCGYRGDPHRGNDNKPSGKRKYKSRHLDDHADDPTWRPGGASSGCRGDRRKERGKERGSEERRRDRRRRRERGRTDRGESSRSREERSPSVEIIYEGTFPPSTPRSPSTKRRRKRSRKPKHNSAPVIITINSDSSHGEDEDRCNNSSPLSGLSNHQPNHLISKLPALPLAGPGSAAAASDDLGVNISELPVDIMDREADKSDGEPDSQPKAAVDPVTVHDSEDSDANMDVGPAAPHPNSESREDDVGASAGQATCVRPQEKERERGNEMKDLSAHPKRRGGGGRRRSRERDGGMRDGERETEDGKDKTAVSADTHLLAAILSDLEGLANPKLNLSPTFDPTDIPPRRNHTHQSSQGVNADVPASTEPRGRMSPVDSHARSHSSLDFHSNSHGSPVDSDLRSHRSCAGSHPRSHSSPLDSHQRSHSSAVDSHPRSHKSRCESDPGSHSSAADSRPRSHKSHFDSDPRSHKSHFDSDPRSHKSHFDSDPRSHISAVDSHPRGHKSRVDMYPSSDGTPVVSHSSHSPNSVLLQQTSPSFPAPPKHHPPAAASSDDDTDFCQLLEPPPTDQKKTDGKRKVVSSPPPLHRFNKNNPGEAKENGIDNVALPLTNRNTPPPLKHKDTKTQAFSSIPPLNVHSPLSESQSTSNDSVSVISPVDFPSNAAIFPIDSHCSSSSFVPKDSQPIPPISTLKRHLPYTFTSRGERTAGSHSAGHRSAVDYHPFSAERHSNSNTSPASSAHTHSRQTHSDSSIDLHSSREGSLPSSGSSSREKTVSSWMSPIHSPQLGTKSSIDLTQLAKTSPFDISNLFTHSSYVPPRPYAHSFHSPTRDGHPPLLHKSPIERRGHKHSYPGQPSSSPIEHKATRDSKLSFDPHWEPRLSGDSRLHPWTLGSKSSPNSRVCIDSRSKSPPNAPVRIDSSSWPRVDSSSKSSPTEPVRIDSHSESNKPFSIDSVSKSPPNDPVRIDTCSKTTPNDPERNAKPPIESYSKPLFPSDRQWESGPSIDSGTECPDKDNESKSSHCPSHSETQCDIEGNLVDRTVSPIEDGERT